MSHTPRLVSPRWTSEGSVTADNARRTREVALSSVFFDVAGDDFSTPQDRRVDRSFLQSFLAFSRATSETNIEYVAGCTYTIVYYLLLRGRERGDLERVAARVARSNTRSVYTAPGEDLLILEYAFRK